MKKKTKEYDFTILEQKVDKLVKLIAAGLTEGKKLNEQVKILSSSGFKPKEIADFLNTTANSVSVTLTRCKNERK